MAEEEDELQPKRRRRGLLKMFYGSEARSEAAQGDPLDINSAA